LFEEQTPRQPIKRFMSHKEIMHPKPNKITIKVNFGKSKEFKHVHRDAKFKTRSIKTFYHAGTSKQELKQK
jgi:hypothetical protein